MVCKEIKIDLLIHDLKGPLAVIHAGLSGLLSRPEVYGTLTPRQQKVIKRLMRNTRTAQLLVNDALELGRASQGVTVWRETSIGGLITEALIELFDGCNPDVSERLRNVDGLEALASVTEAEGLRIDIETAVWMEAMMVDTAKTRQILRNLLNNAFKYKNKAVTLSVRPDCKGMIYVVSDDGEGIPATEHERIFQCYFQLDPGDSGPTRGHGIGLAGALALVKDLGGWMTLESDSGKGAAFTVFLPHRGPDCDPPSSVQ